MNQRFLQWLPVQGTIYINKILDYFDREYKAAIKVYVVPISVFTN